MSAPTTADFEKALKIKITSAQTRGATHLDVNSGAFHRELGGYPGKGHAMPSCCAAMLKMMGPRDIILQAPPKGKGASLTIRYFFGS